MCRLWTGVEILNRRLALNLDLDLVLVATGLDLALGFHTLVAKQFLAGAGKVAGFEYILVPSL